jgi:hypothetical protein
MYCSASSASYASCAACSCAAVQPPEPSERAEPSSGSSSASASDSVECERVRACVVLVYMRRRSRAGGGCAGRVSSRFATRSRGVRYLGGY